MWIHFDKNPRKMYFMLLKMKKMRFFAKSKTFTDTLSCGKVLPGTEIKPKYILSLEHICMML